MSEKTDREGKLRIPPPLYDRWLRRCHRDGVDPDQAAAMWLERGLRRDLALTSEDTIPAAVDAGDDEDSGE